MSTSLRQLLHAQVHKIPTKDVLAIPKKSLKWDLRALLRHSRAFADGMNSLGFQNKTVVASFLDLNRAPEHLAISYGSIFQGAQLHCQPRNQITDVKQVLSKSNVEVLVVDESDLPKLYETVPELKEVELCDPTLKLTEFPKLKYILHTGIRTTKGTHRFRDILLYNFNGDAFEGSGGSVTIDGKAQSENDLISKGKKLAQEVNLKQEGRLMYDAANPNSLFESSIACMMNFGKLIVPELDQVKEALDNEKTDVTAFDELLVKLSSKASSSA